MFDVELICNKSKCYAKYIYIEEESDRVYLIYVNGVKELGDFEKCHVEINCRIREEKIFQLIVRNQVFTYSGECLMITGEVEFLHDYHEYDQELVDLFFHWDSHNKVFCYGKECTSTYNYATLLYSGVPQSVMLDKSIVIEGGEILNKYHFFNVLARELLGEYKYLASNLDALDSSLKESGLDVRRNNCTISIHEASKLKSTINRFQEGYFEEVVSILNDFGFRVNLFDR